MSNGKTSGIMPRVYKSGSIIYFEGDKSEYIYVQKSGKVILTSINLETGEEIKEEVRTGEFFGVKSALGRYPREETAQTVGETVVLLFQLADFERLVLSNVAIVQKMLRVFSNQLRRIGKTVRSVLGEEEIVNVDEQLFKTGEYYYTKGEFHHAQYIFKKYMEYYPDTERAGQAMAKIKSISTGEAVAAAPEAAPVHSNPSPSAPVSDDYGEESYSEEPFESYDEGGDVFDNGDGDRGGQTALTDEMDDFLDNMGADGLDGFDDLNSGGASAESAYNKGMELSKAGNYAKAMEKFREASSKTPASGKDKPFIEKAEFETARCQAESGQKKEAVISYTSFIKKYPNSALVKNVLVNIGEIFAAVNQKDKARSYFSKAASMMPKDRLNELAENRLKRL